MALWTAAAQIYDWLKSSMHSMMLCFCHLSWQAVQPCWISYSVWQDSMQPFCSSVQTLQETINVNWFDFRLFVHVYPTLDCSRLQLSFSGCEFMFLDENREMWLCCQCVLPVKMCHCMKHVCLYMSVLIGKTVVKHLLFKGTVCLLCKFCCYIQSSLLLHSNYWLFVVLILSVKY